MFYVAVDDPLDIAIKSAPEGTLEVTPKDTLEISFELQLWLHLVMQALIHKCVQNGSSNDGPDEVC